MNNFNKNPFGNNMNQTRIVSRYNQASKDGGRISTEEVKKNMQQLKGKDVKINVFPNTQNNHMNLEQQMSNNQTNISSNNQTSNQNPQNFNNKNSMDQMKFARDRMNSFRNVGKF